LTLDIFEIECKSILERWLSPACRQAGAEIGQNPREYMERWLSGRKRHAANVLGEQSPRGFESHPLRNLEIWNIASKFTIIRRDEKQGANEVSDSPEERSDEWKSHLVRA
jgi:hypothetical protein